jgi:acetyl-CoA synthetase
MPMIPEAAVAMLACTRIGATHSVVFAGFSSEAVRDRMNDAEAKLIVTADGGYRRGANVPLKANVDNAVTSCPTVKHVVVVKRTGENIPMKAGRDVWWHEHMEKGAAECAPEAVDSEHPLFILYTSGTTGKPKGVVHGTGGYLLQVALTTKYVFDLKDEDVYWCTADIGWVTGHSYVVYGPLCHGGTTLIYEGAPNHPPRTASGASARGTRPRSSIPRRRPSAPSCDGATSGRRSTTSRACAFSARWGSRSTPRRGCGTDA